MLYPKPSNTLLSFCFWFNLISKRNREDDEIYEAEPFESPLVSKFEDHDEDDDEFDLKTRLNELSIKQKKLLS